MNNTLIFFVFCFFMFILFSRFMYLFFRVGYILFEKSDFKFKGSVSKWAIREKLLLVGPGKILMHIIKEYPLSFWPLIGIYVLAFIWILAIEPF